jgi:signal transduction histidine kinase
MTENRDSMVDQTHLREMIEVISGELELRTLLTTIVQKACELLHADRGSIGLVDPKEDLVRIEAVYQMPPVELGSTAKPGEGLAGKVYSQRAPVLIERYGDIDDPQIGGIDEDSVLGMPIMWRGDMIGTFGIGAVPPRKFDENDIHMLEVFARHAAIAINNARSYEQEKSYAALKERQRLARDLHDNVSQLLFSLTLVAQSIGAGYEKNKDEGAARTKRLLEIAGLAQQEMKALLAELKGPVEEEGSLAAFARRNGLKKAVERHCALAAPDGISIFIDIPEETGLSETHCEILLRICQEALANAFRHGKPSQVRISLTVAENDLRFLIEDDGKGLSQPEGEQAASTHIGVSSMRARAERAGGVLKLTNRGAGGACVEVLLPLA